MTDRLRIAALALAGWLVSAPALAAGSEHTTAVAIDIPAIEASVNIANSLKPYPALIESLTAAGRRTVAKMRRDAEQDRKDNPDWFSDHRRYSFERTYSERSKVGRYISILRSDFSYAGGAHPNTTIDAILWDSINQKAISLRPFFTETRADGPTMRTLAHAIRVALATEKRKRKVPVDDPDSDSSLAAVKPKLTAIGAAVLAPSTTPGRSAGLLFYFSPYDVGAYAEGSYVAFVPWTTFRSELSAEGKAIFGGTRPTNDADRD